jgi:hypothetical protein
MPSSDRPVLIIGGSGVVGSRAAEILKRLHPHLPIAIGGRDLPKAQAVADRLNGAGGPAGSSASAVRIDLADPQLGLAEGASFSAIATFVKDETLSSLRYAQAHGLPYVSLSSGTFEIGPEVALFVHHPASAPILLASHWLAGAATLPTLLFAREYQAVERVAIGVLLDEEDMGGPAAYADYQRIVGAGPASLVLQNGSFTWVGGADADGHFVSVDGVEMPARAYSPLDVVSLAASLEATSIRMDLVLGQSASRRRGEPFSTEIVVELTGRGKDGRSASSRHEIVHPSGQAPLTGLAVALGIERLLGLHGGPPVAPGLYMPEVVLDPAYFVRRMEEFGARFNRAR